MSTCSRLLSLCLVNLALFNLVASAHSPVDFLEVVSVKPARSIEHGVELKSKFDVQRVETQLEGPQLFSRSVGCLDRPEKDLHAYLNWFKITQPQVEPVREVVVLDMVRGASNKKLRIKGAEYVLTPAQLITNGPPNPIPNGLDHYKAFRVIDAPSIDQDVTLTGSIAIQKRRLGKPLYVCLPVREWHHEEFFDASHPNDCFVVYEMDRQTQPESFSTIDQFGLNELQCDSNQWLCVRAALLGGKPQ